MFVHNSPLPCRFLSPPATTFISSPTASQLREGRPLFVWVARQWTRSSRSNFRMSPTSSQRFVDSLREGMHEAHATSGLKPPAPCLPRSSLCCIYCFFHLLVRSRRTTRRRSSRSWDTTSAASPWSRCSGRRWSSCASCSKSTSTRPRWLRLSSPRGAWNKRPPLPRVCSTSIVSPFKR